MRVVYNRREPLVNLRDEVFHSMFFNFFTPRIIIGLCALGILTASVFIAPAVTEAVPKKICGLAWNPIVGWIRQQDAIRDTTTNAKKGSFGVTKADDGSLTGWSWSPKFGWICWGATCNTADIRNAPNKYGNPDYLNARSVGDATFRTNGPVAQVNVDNTVDGWIKLLSWKDRGWISLSKKTSGGANNYTVTLDQVKNEFKGWAWGGANMGWLVFSGRSIYEIKSKPPCPRGTVVCSGTDAAGVPYQSCKSSCVAPETPIDCAGKCATTLVCATDPDDGSLKRCLLNPGDRGADDPNKGKFIGRACDPYCESSVDARESADLKTKWKTFYIGPWVQARGGTVASVGGLDATAPPPSPEKNADFLVLSGKRSGSATAITQFEGACEESGLPKNTCKRFGAISSGNRIKSGSLSSLAPKRTEIIVGGSTRRRIQTRGAHLDIDAVTTESDDPSSADPRRRNNLFRLRVEKKNHQANNTESQILQALADKTQDGSIFFYDGDLTLGDQIGMNNNPWLIENKNANKSGGMTFVIRGNLTIKHSLRYIPGTVSALKQIASVAWIVLRKNDDPRGLTSGNIIIDPCTPPTDSSLFAAELAGIFFAENTIKTGTGDVTACESNQLFRDWKRQQQTDITALSGQITATTARANAEADPVARQALLDQVASFTALRSSKQSIVDGMTNKTSDVALRINGLMIAKQFVFERKYGGGDTAAEAIMNDGRYRVTIPPGLEDVLKHLPQTQ